MKYYMLTQEEGNHIPYNINSNRGVDIRWINPDDINKIGRKNIMSMDIPMDVFFPDMLFDPCILVSKMCMKTILMYWSHIRYKSVKLLHLDTRTHATYFIPLLDEVDCISDRTQYNNIGNRIIKLVLAADKIGKTVVFRIAGYDQKYMIGREDFVESILRRGARGIRFEEIETDGNQ